jgi:hypothetical protein
MKYGHMRNTGERGRFRGPTKLYPSLPDSVGPDSTQVMKGITKEVPSETAWARIRLNLNIS